MPIELEARFHNISSVVFEALKPPLVPNVSTSIVYAGQVRVVTDADGKITIVKKRDLQPYNQTVREWGRLVEAEETILNIMPTGPAEMTRTRERWTRVLENGSTLDVSRVVTTGAREDRWNGIKYEVEVEMMDPDTMAKREAFERDRVAVEKTIKQIREIVEIFNAGSNERDLGERILARPRNLKRDDFSSFFEARFEKSLSDYTVTPKADGIQRCLFISPLGMWWIYPPNFIERIPDVTTTTQTFLLVGELIKGEKRTDGKQKDLFCPFDTLYAETDIRDSQVHADRMAIAQAVATGVGEGLPFEFYFKEFYDIGRTPEDFAMAYSKAVAGGLPFETDGAIMTPSTGSHQPMREYKPIQQRRLCVQADLCKIKPLHLLSIDFRVLDGKIYSGDRKKEPTPFPPARKLRHPNPVIEYDLSPYNGRIVEFLPKLTEKGWSLVPGRIRTDKLFPNSLESAIDVWNDIHEPITEDFLLGRDFGRLFIQNNVVKRQLLDGIAETAIVIDIGSGRGGDLRKYTKGVHIVCVEPDPVNYTELQKRHANLEPEQRRRFSLLGCGGEETEIIMEHLQPILLRHPYSPIIVVSMLSLSFFWKDAAMLNQFKQTLVACAEKRRTSFVALTIEGKRTQKYIETYGHDIAIGPVTMHYDPSQGGVSLPGMISIQIKDTIVRGQDEYLVNLEDLRDTIDAKALKSSVIEPYLTAEEKAFGNLYVQWAGEVKSSRYTQRDMMSSLVVGTETIPAQSGTKLSGDYIALPAEPDHFFGSFLLAVSNYYQNSAADARAREVAKLRSEFSSLLAVENPSVTVEEARAMYGGSPYDIFPALRGKSVENSYIFTLSQGTVQQKNMRGVADPLEMMVNGIRSGKTLPLEYMPLLTDYFRINFQLVTWDGDRPITKLMYNAYPGQRRLLMATGSSGRVVGRMITAPGVQPLIKLHLK